MKMIQKWFSDFRCGRTSTDDAERSGRTNEGATPENMEEIHDMILNDPKTKLWELAKTVSMSVEHVVNIVHAFLHMKKLSARWLPRLLKVDQKRIRITVSSRI
jgi:[histone H3]-lysine36 N-dimethyltransferase SETMAR